MVGGSGLHLQIAISHCFQRRVGSSPWIVTNRATSLVTDLRRYSSSSTVPFLPDPTFLSIFLLDRELRLGDHSYKGLTKEYRWYTHFDDLDAEVGATV